MVSDYITPQLGFSVIPGGVQRFHLHYLKQASNDDIDAYVEIQLADSTGTPIGPTITSNVGLIGWVTSVIPVEVNLDLVIPTTTIDPTNRMIVRLYLNSNESSSKSVVYYTEGTSYYSFIVTSVGAIAGTSGTSGVNGSSGTSGTSGISITGPTGPTGPSGGGGGSTPVQLYNQTLATGGWSYGGSYYSYTFSDAAITTTCDVSFTPYISSNYTTLVANVYPFVGVTAGSCTFNAQYLPSAPITGNIVITQTT